MRNPNLLTLTMVRQKELTRERVRFLRGAFQRLLHRKYFRLRVRGGLYVIEAKYNGERWNVHIHALIDSLYMEQAVISKAWREVTGDSYIVDIRHAYSAGAGLSYILKYLGKAPNVAGQEGLYDTVLRGARLAQTFGAFYRVKASKPFLACPRCGCTNWLTEFRLREAMGPANLVRTGPLVWT